MRVIKVPEGKTLLSSFGNYVFEGPTTVYLNRGLHLFPTYTDGTSWESSDFVDNSAAPSETIEKTEVLDEVLESMQIKKIPHKKEKKDVGNVALRSERNAPRVENPEDNIEDIERG